MRALVTGAGGQLGRDLVATFTDAGGDVTGLTRHDLNVSDRVTTVEAIVHHRPDVILHAGAFTKVDACEADPMVAWNTNAAGTWWVAQAAREVGATLVYVSTDYVFSGRAGRPYSEFDRVDPRSVYGRTKEAGEQLVRETLDQHVIVRTSWLHGRHGGNFARTMLRLARDREELAVVDDQVGRPTFTFDLAPAISWLIDVGARGTFHVTGSGACSWYEFARAVIELSGVAARVRPIDTATFGALAPRPADSRLDGVRTAMVGLKPLPDWRESLPRLLSDVSFLDRHAHGGRQAHRARASSWQPARNGAQSP